MRAFVTIACLFIIALVASAQMVHRQNSTSIPVGFEPVELLSVSAVDIEYEDPEQPSHDYHSIDHVVIISVTDPYGGTKKFAIYKSIEGISMVPLD